MLWRKTLIGLTASASAELAPLWDYEFLMPERQLLESITFFGTGARLRNFVSCLKNGCRTLKVGVVGGSWSYGSNAASYEESWFPIFAKWLDSVSSANVSSRNGAANATPPFYMVYCLMDHLDEDVDLVLVEFTPNDLPLDTIRDNKALLDMEKLFRRLLVLPHRPAVVMVANPRLSPPAYFYTTEYLQAANTLHYDIPVVSPHTSLHQLVFTYPTEGFAYNQTYHERHPGNSGHKMLVDTVVHLLQTAALDLVHRPLTPAEVEALAAPLPDPIHPGNYPPAAATCLVAHKFPPIVTSAAGFEWKLETSNNKHKWGYISETPGSTLLMQVNTERPWLPRATPLSMKMQYLASYSAMGTARVDCLRGCRCGPFQVDAHINWTFSQSFQVDFWATQHPDCLIQVTLLDKTSTGGHKFKVTGLMIADPPAEQQSQSKTDDSDRKGRQDMEVDRPTR